MVSSTRAAFIHKPGPPDEIVIGELPLPSLQRGEVLVKVSAAAVDPIDTYIRAGSYKIDLPDPFIIGRDMVGIVVATGDGAARFKVGESVWCNNQGYAGRQGTFAEYLVIEESLLYRVPDGVDEHNLVASVHSALTAYVGLVVKAQVKKNETVFINGGSGNVGNCAIQLAKHLGAQVAVTAGSPQKAEWCKQSGADCVIDYKREDISERLKSFAPDGANVYWELTQKPDVQKAVLSLSRRGRILLSSGLKHVSQLNVGAFYTHNCTIYGFTITDLNEDELQEHAEKLNGLFEQNVFKSRISRQMTLSQAADAHRLVESGEVEGKVLICFDEL